MQQQCLCTIILRLMHSSSDYFCVGGKFAFVWDIVHRTCGFITRPLVLFIKDAEHTVCGSYEREAAFQNVFGTRATSMDSLGATEHTASVLIAGCSLGDVGVDIAPQTL